MIASSSSTIAQLRCFQCLPLNFAKLVGEIDKLLLDWLDHPVKARWDSDTVVTFDQPGTRILLGWSPTPGQGISGVLTLSVGPSPMLGRPVMRPDAQELCHRLVAAVEPRIHTDEVLWHQIACQMSEEWVDLLIDALPDRGPGHSPTPHSDAPHHPTPPSNLAVLAPYEFAQARLRAVMVQEEPRLSAPMRLTIHALNATLIMVWGPLGAAAMAHGLVTGENPRLAAHLMVLTGLATTVMHNAPGLSFL